MWLGLCRRPIRPRPPPRVRCPLLLLQLVVLLNSHWYRRCCRLSRLHPGEPWLGNWIWISMCHHDQRLHCFPPRPPQLPPLCANPRFPKSLHPPRPQHCPLFRSSSFSFGTIRKHHRKDEDDMTKSEEVRSVLRLLPIWTACLAYGVVFAQIMTFFNKQGRTLDHRLFGSLELPPAALQTFGPAAILLFVPIYDRVLVPALRCVTGNPSGLTPLQRVGTGMVVSLATMCVAALVEARRLETAHEYGLMDDARATVPMSWVWLVPQYVMIGVADVFAVVGMQEFFYDQMPSELRSLGLALYFSVMGIGGFISGALISLIDRVTTHQQRWRG
uniref:Peptide/nitrate transporter n=1 Tax=Triticum urartu TaxID=4572 RepID=A0A8R7RA06_TRIUA